MKPKVHDSCFIADNATIIGDVELAQGVSVWYGAVIRGDQNYIRIGKDTNVQDNCVIHVTNEDSVEIGENVSLGHACIIHGAKLGSNIIVGMNATVLNGAVVGDGSVIGAGAVVPQGMKIPPKSLVLGVPAKIIKENSDEVAAAAKNNGEVYCRLRDEHLEGKHELWMD